MHQRDASLPQLLLLQMHMLWRPSVCDPILFRSTCHTQLVLKSIASSYQYHQITWKIWQYLVLLWKWLDYKILNMTLVRLNLVGVKLYKTCVSWIALCVERFPAIWIIRRKKQLWFSKVGILLEIQPYHLHRSPENYLNIRRPLQVFFYIYSW